MVPNHIIFYFHHIPAYGSKHSSGDGPQLEPGVAATISGATPAVYGYQINILYL